jgi:predicted RNase H-like nuclease
VDAGRRGWVAVSLAALSLAAGGLVVTVKVAASLSVLLAPELDLAGTTIVGIDMPLGLLETGWREADRAARGLLGPRRGSVFAIPPRAVWAETSYLAANQRCRELTGQGFSAQAWGLRAKLLPANQYRQGCGHPLYEVHPELAFGAMAGAPLAASKHTSPGRDERCRLLARRGVEIPARTPAALITWRMRRSCRVSSLIAPRVGASRPRDDLQVSTLRLTAPAQAEPVHADAAGSTDYGRGRRPAGRRGWPRPRPAPARRTIPPAR